MFAADWSWLNAFDEAAHGSDDDEVGDDMDLRPRRNGEEPAVPTPPPTPQEKAASTIADDGRIVWHSQRDDEEE